MKIFQNDCASMFLYVPVALGYGVLHALIVFSRVINYQTQIKIVDIVLNY